MGGIFSKIAASIAASKASRMAVSWGSWFMSSWAFDDLLYPAVIAWLGPLRGGLIMTTLAMTACWLWLKQIVKSDKEWFGMDVLHKLQKVVFWAVRITQRIPFVRKSWVDAIERGLTFLLINMLFDPMISVLYHRFGDTAKTLTQRDKKIFWWSGLVSNLYWTLRSWGIVVVIKFIWKSIFQ